MNQRYKILNNIDFKFKQQNNWQQQYYLTDTLHQYINMRISDQQDFGSVQSQFQQNSQPNDCAKLLLKSYHKIKMFTFLIVTTIAIMSLIYLKMLNQKQDLITKVLQEKETSLKKFSQESKMNFQKISKAIKDNYVQLSESQENIINNLQKKIKNKQTETKQLQQQIQNNKQQQNVQIKSTFDNFNAQLIKVNSKLRQNLKTTQQQNNEMKQLVQTSSKQLQKLKALIEDLANKQATLEIQTQTDVNIVKVEDFRSKNRFFNVTFSEAPHQLQFHPPFKWYNRNHAHYLQKQQVESVLEVGCFGQCLDLYKNDEDYKLLNTTFYKESNGQVKHQAYDWVIIRYNSKIRKEAFFYAQFFMKDAKKGVTLIFNNMRQYRQFNGVYRESLNNLMNYYRFQYDEAISLNLRRREGKILLVFSHNVKRSTFPFKKPIKNQIAIQFELKFEQNIPYLREWIGYHIYLGVDKFFVYDNNGSVGETNKSNETNNKYGLSFSCLNKTEKDIIDEWQSVWQQFYEHIIYLPWQYLNSDGDIAYAQMESMADYINNFQDTTAYVGFIDSDEILFSISNLKFPQYLTRKSLEGFSRVRLRQKKFVGRYCVPHSRVLDINQGYEVDTSGWAEKQFLETCQYYPGPSPHYGRTFNGKQYTQTNQSIWRFNHYNLIEGMIRYSQGSRDNPGTHITHDDSGRRQKDIIDKICQGKCSENFAVICQLKDQKYSCPIDGKEYAISPNVLKRIKERKEKKQQQEKERLEKLKQKQLKQLEKDKNKNKK